ncbi:WhiB family transcriptional regulator [Streptomyces sp. NBC_01617]|uniref:WhiB family transcriptional regulator n=1 Tax=unclassified Streptomyces TaxID=2593676 RepID=UPI0038708CA8|nr:WhiB family transcriptional regulator [Streptomyces sp. NBC_01620]WTE63069.1 WhiB family transcriptional regulator [Streptomyces sp. NBC_01617]
MTSNQARHTRRSVLQSAIDAGARCATADPDLWFRTDGEPQITWQARRAEAIRVCTGCPVRAVCKELALRDGDGNHRVDDMVRGGLSGAQLAVARTAEADRLTAAVDADQDTQGRLLDDLSVELRTQAGLNPDGRRKGGRLRQDENRTEQNLRIRALAASIRQIRTARRARAGWGVAA